MIRENDFEDIRPYHDIEINAALNRIIVNPAFDTILDTFFPNEDKSQLKALLADTYTVRDFQVRFMYPLVYSIVGRTSDGLTSDGFENLTPGKSYLFVGNHRDIVLDSAILQVLLLDHKHDTSEITFGSNLMSNQFIIDLGKVNRMFKVVRGYNKAELIRNSEILSAYIRHTVTVKGNSIWIAQRPGRTKDGCDKTEPGLLKMFNMSSRSNFTESFKELNIVPLVISYEYEPCCSLKIKELLETAINGTYQKKPGEDLMSILTGINQPKGRIHMTVCKPLNFRESNPDKKDTLNSKINMLAQSIDREIFSHFKLWPNNYIACDLLLESQQYREYYTPEDLQGFLKYMESQTENIEGNKATVRKLFLKIYANPVLNARA
ncbi:MAG: acyltransferase [Bacteroidales bacterium]